MPTFAEPTEVGGGAGELPAHHGDGRFVNPGVDPGPPPNVGPVIGLPFLFRRVAVTLAGDATGAPRRIANDGRALAAGPADDGATVTWVGHSTLVVQMDGVTFLTDPTWSPTASPLPVGPRRFVEPGLAIDALPPIDFVVVSHNHYDHLDLDTLRRLSNGTTRFFVPLGNGALLDGEGIGPVVELDWWQSATVGAVEVHCVPALHWSRRGLFDTNRALWSGWAVTSPQRRFYFAGDTAAFDGFAEIGERLGPFDLAAVPIGAYSPVEMMKSSHLDPEQAVDAVLAVGARRSLAVHYGTFDLSDEPLDEPPRRFRAASQAAGRSALDDWLFDVGETRPW